MTTKDVLDHHLAAFASNDLDETMKDYTDDSVLILPDQTLKGVAALRAAFTQLFEGPFKPGTYEFTMDRIDVAGEVAYTVWHAKVEGGSIPVGTDTFVIRDGKIVVQTFAMHAVQDD